MSLRDFPLVAMIAATLWPAVAGAGEGAISGIVTFRGAAPENKAQNRQSDPFCAKTRGTDESIVIGKSGGLRDVVIALPPGTKGKGKASPAPILDQKACRYTPRVFVGRPEQTVKV